MIIIPVIKALLVIIIMVTMVLLLLGIDQIFHSSSRREDADAERMRRDMENKREVITKDSVFHELVRTEGVPAKGGSTGERNAGSHHSTARN